MRKLIPVLLITAIAFFLVRSARSTAVPAVGRTAPDFTLNSEAGKPITLSQYRGKWVVLYFYPKDTKVGGAMEEQRFRRDEAKYDALNAVVLGVFPQSLASHQLAGADSSTFKLLVDAGMHVTGKYGPVENYNIGTTGARSNFLINPEGEIADEYVGVDPDNHSKEVLAKLAKLEKP